MGWNQLSAVSKGFLEFQHLRNALGGEINADFDDGDGLFFDQKKVRKKAPILQNTAVGEVSFHQRESPKASNFHLLKNGYFPTR